MISGVNNEQAKTSLVADAERNFKISLMPPSWLQYKDDDGDDWRMLFQ